MSEITFTFPNSVHGWVNYLLNYKTSIRVLEEAIGHDKFIDIINKNLLLKNIVIRMTLRNKQECMEVLTELIESGADINILDGYGKTLLHTCCKLASNVDVHDAEYIYKCNMYYDLIEFVINNRAIVNAKGSVSSPPIFECLDDTELNARIVKLLIDNRADLEIKGQDNFTALQYYCSRGNWQHHPYPVLKVLIESGAKTEGAKNKLKHWQTIEAFTQFETEKEHANPTAKKSKSTTRGSRREVPYGGVGRRKRKSKTQKRKDRC